MGMNGLSLGNVLFDFEFIFNGCLLWTPLREAIYNRIVLNLMPAYVRPKYRRKMCQYFQMCQLCTDFSNKYWLLRLQLIYLFYEHLFVCIFLSLTNIIFRPKRANTMTNAFYNFLHPTPSNICSLNFSIICSLNVSD